MCRGCLKGDLSLSFLSNIATFSFVVLYLMRHLRESLRLSSILRQFKCCNMSPTLHVFRCLLVTIDRFLLYCMGPSQNKQTQVII